MAENDCGVCEQLINCGYTISEKQFPTIAIRLLCEIATNSGGGGLAEAVTITQGGLTATVRDTGANDSLNVSIVDAAGNQITSFGGGTEYVEDTPSAGGESMTLAGAVRDDVPAGLTSTDGDYANLITDDVNKLWVNASGETLTTEITQGGLTATVRNTGANDSLNVSIVDAAGNQITTFGGGTVVEDTPATGGEALALIGVVRDDVPAGQTTADNDYSVLIVDDVSKLWVNASGETLTTEITQGGLTATVRDTGVNDSLNVSIVDAAGNQITTFGGAAVIEDTPSTGAESLTMAGAVREDVPAVTTSTDGDYSTLKTDNEGKLWVNASNDPIPVTDNGGSLTVDGTVAVSGGTIVVTDGGGSITVDGSVTSTISGTVDTELPAAAVLADDTPNPTTTSVGTFPHWFDGATWDRATGDSAQGLDVDVTRMPSTVVEDAASAGGETMVLVGAVRQDTLAASTSTDGDFAYLKTNAAGALRVDGSGSTQPISGTASITGVIDTELPSAVALTDNTANPTVPGVAAFQMVWDGATWDRMPGTSAAGMSVSTTVLEDVAATAGGAVFMAGTVRRDTPAGDTSTDGDNATLVTDAQNRLWVRPSATVVEDVASAGGGHMLQVAAVRQDTLATSVDTDGDNAWLKVDSVGALWVNQKTTEATYDYGTLGFASVVSASYTNIAGALANARVFLMVNKTDRDVLVSFDGGTTDHAMCPTGGAITLDWGTGGLVEGGEVDVKAIGSDATSGNIYATLVA